MRLEDSPRTDEYGEDAQCNVEGCGGTYVRYENDITCRECGHMYDEHTTVDPLSTEGAWERFWNERKDYDGHYGHDRKRCVGGFVSSY